MFGSRFDLRKLSIIALCAFLFFVSCSPRYVKTSPLKVTFIDVGHGDCILIQTPDDGIKVNGKYEGKVILIDGGEETEGNKVIIPYLEAHGITKDRPIDFLIMTHAHSDHVGGLIPIIEEYQIKVILDPGYKHDTDLYEAFCELAVNEPDCEFYKPLVGTLIEKEGDTLDWGSELQVKVLNSEQKAEGLNNTSIVLWVKYKEVSFLLTGDAEGKKRNDPPDKLKYVEKDLINENPSKLKTTFLKAGHHGSETSSTNAFIDAVSPEYVIICAGNKEFSGTVLPDKSVIERYEDRGIKIYRTDRDDQKSHPQKHQGMTILS
ncbi:MAG: MBL fold metallo-hydrolase [Candidatus Omnitrophota bacterium]